MLRTIVSFMKNASLFLQYPIIQYIPLTVRTLGKSDNWSNPFHQPTPQFMLFQDIPSLKSAIDRYQAHASLPVENDNELFVLALNFQAEMGLFRFLTCKVIGISKTNSYHVFAFTKKYFPRRLLHFVLTENNGRKLKWLNIEIY